MRFLPNSEKYYNEKHHHLSDVDVMEIMANKDLMDKIHEKEAELEAKSADKEAGTEAIIVTSDGGTLEVEKAHSSSNVDGP